MVVVEGRGVKERRCQHQPGAFSKTETEVANCTGKSACKCITISKSSCKHHKRMERVPHTFDEGILALGVFRGCCIVSLVCRRPLWMGGQNDTDRDVSKQKDKKKKTHRETGINNTVQYMHVQSIGGLHALPASSKWLLGAVGVGAGRRYICRADSCMQFQCAHRALTNLNVCIVKYICIKNAIACVIYHSLILIDYIYI